MVFVVLGLVVLAVVLFEKAQSGSDTMADLGGVVDDSAATVTQQIAQAIATAEGFYVAGSRPQRNNNPGDMTADLVGAATGMDGMFVVYGNVQDGWNNLYAQVNAWLNGTSKHAGPSSTIAQISQFYTTTDQAAWASTVAGSLGVSVDTPISSVGNPDALSASVADLAGAPVLSDDSGDDSTDYYDDSDDSGDDYS